MSSKLYTLDQLDWAKSFLVAIFAAILTSLLAWLDAGNSFNWQELLRAAVTAALAYLAKNFVTDENGKVFGKV